MQVNEGTNNMREILTWVPCLAWIVKWLVSLYRKQEIKDSSLCSVKNFSLKKQFKFLLCLEVVPQVYFYKYILVKTTSLPIMVSS